MVKRKNTKTRNSTGIDKLKIELSGINYTYLRLFNKGGFEYVEYICYVGHKHTTRMYDWDKGVRCGQCKGNIIVTIDQVRESFEKEGYVLHTKNYVNNCTLLYYTCKNKHKHVTNWKKWQRGIRCSQCNVHSLGNNIKYTYKEVKSIFEAQNYILLSKEYINAKTHLNYVCDKGHKHSTKLSKFLFGGRCPTCYRNNNYGENSSGWKGGISLEPYCDAWKDQQYKIDIRKRDSNICQNPYCFGTSKRLAIHHIDYDKKNCHPNNLISVCTGCNSRANKNRYWHTEWYKILMTKKFGYKY